MSLAQLVALLRGVRAVVGSPPGWPAPGCTACRRHPSPGRAPVQLQSRVERLSGHDLDGVVREGQVRAGCRRAAEHAAVARDGPRVVAVVMHRVQVGARADHAQQHLLARVQARQRVVRLVRQFAGEVLREHVGRGAAVERPVLREALGQVGREEPFRRRRVARQGPERPDLLVDGGVDVGVDVADDEQRTRGRRRCRCGCRPTSTPAGLPLG